MKPLLTIFVAALLGTGCADLQLNEAALGATGDLVKAATITDDQARQLGLQSIEHMDQENPIAPPSNPYAKRLASLTRKHTRGGKYNFKVYLVDQVNAFATPDGSIRFYKGLMDMMSDQELLAVVGHEIGHVEKQHSLNRMKKAYALSAARKGLASQDNAVGNLAQSGQIGGLTEALVNSAFSRSDEIDADDYSLVFMKANNYNPKAIVTAFEKLAAKGSSGGLLATHPAADKRAERIRKKIK